MFGQGFVRLTVALVAAVGLHALFFFMLPAYRHTVLMSPEGSMQIDLLTDSADKSASLKQNPTTSEPVVTEQHPSQPVVAEQHPSEPYAKSVLVKAEQSHSVSAAHSPDSSKQKTKPQQSAISMIEAAAAVTKPVSTRVRGAAPQKPVAETVAVTGNKSKAEADASAHSARSVPQSVQKQILARVHYPMQARRHGWQGRAEFELNVDRQLVHSVTLLASTGYPILDRAAQRGLAAVGEIPLSNGLYRMPVVFHLQ